jgi:hypothetical protein
MRAPSCNSGTNRALSIFEPGKRAVEIREHEVREEIQQVVPSAARFEFPSLQGVLQEAGDADVRAVTVGKSDDVFRVADGAAQFAQHGQGQAELAGGGDVGVALNFSRQWSDLRGQSDWHQGEEQGQAEHGGGN